ncbi:MAG: glycerol kinase GlpK [Chlorobi bacterium]|nr:glycerol kinase GlpK [Chlorobiota bacterium]
MYILSLDQGTTSSRAVIYDHDGKICSVAQKEFRQIFPNPGWVEHDPVEIWSSQMAVASEAIAKMGILPQSLTAIGITNQRETTIVWERKTGKPVYNAIVWQDRRTAGYCDELIKSGKSGFIKQKTGLEVDAYFSATKIKWILDHVPGARKKAIKGELAFGTVDSWLIWNLTFGNSHLTDVTNASRTMVFNIHDLQWDDELLELFDIPREMLPEVNPSSCFFTETSGKILQAKIPITGVAGDQQAAMFGQMCIRKGMVKNTYGTGCFLMKNIGDKPVLSEHRLLTTVAWQINGEVVYALEGSVFTAGSLVHWLRDGLQIIENTREIEPLASSVEDSAGVIIVPAFTGLGAPYWKPEATGTINGLTRGSTRAHIARAALESIALQSCDVIRAMEKDTGHPVKLIRADGGASANNLLMQMQADFSQITVERSSNYETTSLGAAYFAGLAVGFWKTTEEIKSAWKADKKFKPVLEKKKAEKKINNWLQAVKKTF